MNNHIGPGAYQKGSGGPPSNILPANVQNTFANRKKINTQ